MEATGYCCSDCRRLDCMKKNVGEVNMGMGKRRIKSDSLAFGFKNWVDDSLYWHGEASVIDPVLGGKKICFCCVRIVITIICLLG